MVLQVSDQGVGIPEDEQNTLLEGKFDKLRAHDAGGDSQRGSGLGLRVVKQIVELHQGQISFKSKVGVGSEFTVTLSLPYTEAATDKETQDDTKEDPADDERSRAELSLSQHKSLMGQLTEHQDEV
ncbi:unnamed protein product [Heterosigma akashiwo]